MKIKLRESGLYCVGETIEVEPGTLVFDSYFERCTFSGGGPLTIAHCEFKGMVTVDLDPRPHGPGSFNACVFDQDGDEAIAYFTPRSLGRTAT